MERQTERAVMDPHFVSFKLHYQQQQQQFPSHLAPFIYGSCPLLGAWDPNRAIEMTRVSELLWELELVIPPCHERVEFNFLVKDVDNSMFWKREEHQRRLLLDGNGGDNTNSYAKFRSLEADEELEFFVSVTMETMSPSSLAAMWKAYRGGLKSSTSGHSLSSDLKGDFQNQEAQRGTVNTEDAAQYQTDNGMDPKGLHRPLSVSAMQLLESEDINLSYKPILRNRSVSVQDLVVLGLESEKLQGICPAVDGHERTYLSEKSLMSPYNGDGNDDNRSSMDGRIMDPSTGEKNMLGGLPTAEALPKVGQHASLVADQLLVPKERRRLAIIMVGLPARGKTFTATKLTRYLRWLGHETKHFNVGQYRRFKHGSNQSADFFRPDNQGGLDARNEVAALAMEDMLTWMQEGGQIGIFDATNSTKQRRNMLLQLSEGKCKVIFLEVLCSDKAVINRNIRLKIQQSPDYVDMPNFEEALKDFEARLANYEKAYEPVAEGSYIKMIDTVGGEGGQVQINNIGGYLPGRILFFLVNTHTNPRPIFLTRPGESLGSVQNLVGGDQNLSEMGERYGKVFANFVNERLKGEETASIWTSTLKRTIATAQHLVQFPKVQWRALDDISAGICDGMTYEEIKYKMAEEYKARSLDKLRYRYPRGESYLDVIQRLEPVIIELERQHSPVIIVTHQAVLRSLYGYFADKPLEQIPYIEIPLHTVIEIQMGLVGVEEKRYKLL
eukprot:c14203_g1_i1 orf=119-2296(+)